MAEGDLVLLLARDERYVQPVYRRDAPRPLAVPAVAERFVPGLDAPCLYLLDEAHQVAAVLVPW